MALELVSPSILIVDEDPEGLETIRAAVSSVPVEIHEAGSIDMIRDMARDHLFAVIIVGLHGEGSSGDAALKALLDVPSLDSVPIVCVSDAETQYDVQDSDPTRTRIEYVYRPWVSSIVGPKVRVYVELYLQRQVIASLRTSLEQVHGDFDRIANASIEMEKRIKSSEQQFRSAMEYASIGMALVSTEGKWLKVNKALCQMVGYTASELLEIDFQTLTHPDDLELDLDYVHQMLNKEIDTYQMEKRYFHKDTSIVWVLLSVSLVWASETEPLYFISQIQNITARKQAEAEKEAFIRQLQRSNDELKRFAYICSHDLREPARAISNFSELLVQEYQDRLDDQGAHFLNVIHKHSEQMLDMIRDILTFSRVDRENLELELVDCAEVVADVLETCDRDIHQTQAEIIVDESLPVIQCSKVLLLALFQNLVSNALKFQAGETSPEIKIAVSERDSDWVFSVSDNGIGIDPQYRDEVFAMFRRINRKDEYPGTGIGLSICRKSIELLGGKIWFESEFGKGTKFFFTVPKIG